MKSSAFRSHRLNRRLPLGVAAFATAVLLFPQSALAATAVWNGAGTDFNTGANWTSGTGAGGIPGTGDYAQFANGMTAQPNLGSALTILGVNFAATANGYDLTSGSGNTVALTLTSTGSSSTAAVRSTAGAGLSNTINAPLVLGGSGAMSIDQSGGGSLVINGVISGNTNLTGVSFITSSGGTMTLAGLNTFAANATVGSSLGVTINTVGNAGFAGSLGAGTTINLGNAAIAGVLNYVGAGETSNKVINLSGTTGGATINTTGATGALNLTANWTATGAGTKLITLTGNNTGITNAISGNIVENSPDNPTGLRKDGTGTWTLSGSNTYTGQTDIRAGILQVSSLNKVSGGTASSSLGAPTTVANGTLLLGSSSSTGQLTYLGSGETTDRVLKFNGTTGGAIIDQSGAGLLKFSDAGAIAAGAGVKTVTLQGSTAGAGEIVGIIKDNSGINKTSLAKQGTGTWTLSGANTYTGATVVNAGSLFVNGSITSAVTVNAGTFGGNGSSNANITVGTGVGAGATFAPGNNTVGTFTTTGSVSLLADATYRLEFNSSTSSFDKIVAAGLSIASGAHLTLMDLGTSTVLAAGTQFTIFDNTSGSITGAFLGLAEGATITNGLNSFTINYNAGTGSNDIVLTVAAIPEPSTCAFFAGAGLLLFSGIRRKIGAALASC